MKSLLRQLLRSAPLLCRELHTNLPGFNLATIFWSGICQQGKYIEYWNIWREGDKEGVQAVLWKLRGCQDDVEMEEVKHKWQIMIFLTWQNYPKLNVHVQGDERGRKRAKTGRFFLVWNEKCLLHSWQKAGGSFGNHCHGKEFSNIALAFESKFKKLIWCVKRCIFVGYHGWPFLKFKT